MAKKQKKFKDQLTQDIGDNIKSQNQAQQAIAEFSSLKDHPGWQRVVGELQKKVDEQTDEILDTDAQGEDLNRLRDRRDLTLWFKNLPDILIAYLQNPPAQVEMEDFDPYTRPKVDNEEQ